MLTQLFPHVFWFLTAFIFFYKWQTHKNKTHPPLPPGPITYPIIGCLPQFIMNKPTSRWIHNLMNKMQTEIACFRIGNTNIIPVASPELACEFLKKHDAIFISRPKVISANFVSNGYLGAVLTPYGNQWKKMRRVVSQFLSASMHEHFHDIRCAEADELVRYVYNECQKPVNNGVVNVRTITQQYCGWVIKKMMFGKRSFSMTTEGGPGMEDREHMDAMFATLSYLYGFAIGDFIPLLEVFDFDGHKKTISKTVNILRKHQDLEVNKRIEMWKMGIRTSEVDVLDRLINLKDSNNNPLLTADEINAQVTEMLLATVDNPSNAVEWTIAEMINQPNILNKACKELDEVVGRERLVQESDLSKLIYITACAKESLRLHPTAPFNLPHVSTEEVVVGGYHIPKGSHVLLCRAGLGRNPRVWEDPLRYDPERHILHDQSNKKVVLVDPELRILSFSIGRRGCPGALLGSTLLTMLLARLIQGFHWKAPPRGPSTIDLVECQDGNLLMEKPLLAYATPRLGFEVYMNLFK